MKTNPKKVMAHKKPFTTSIFIRSREAQGVMANCRKRGASFSGVVNKLLDLYGEELVKSKTGTVKLPAATFVWPSSSGELL